MTKTLTEQWRDGELFGFHYVKVPKEEPSIHNVSCMDYLLDEYGVEVLAPVPSYDKVKEMSKKIERLEFDNEALEMAHNEGKEINDELVSKTDKLEKKLKIATKALKKYMTFCRHPAEEALKEMEGVK